MLSLDEAKSMLTEEKLEKLRNFVKTSPTINTGNKSQCDILMRALCNAVSDGTLDSSNLSEKIIRLLNSTTTTLTNVKLESVLRLIRKRQPNVVCDISIETNDMKETLHTWRFDGSEDDVTFNDIFREVVQRFDITPQLVRTKMTETLKPTIVNNIAQLIAKYEIDPALTDVNVSINTISRLVNMQDHLLFAEFIDLEKDND